MTRILCAATAVAVLLPVPTLAQAMDHAKMKMDMPMPAKPAVKAKLRAKPKPKPPALPASAGFQSRSDGKTGQPLPPSPAAAGPRPASGDEASAVAAPAPAPAPEQAMPMDHSTMDHGKMDHGDMAGMAGMAGMSMGRGGDAYGDGSGTSRLPAAEGAMHGVHFNAGDWALMLHGYAWGVYTDQGGRRGDNMAFVESMAMLVASRDLGDTAHLQLRSMLSLEPLMGARGYPNLLATGEVANGQPLIDRQHPHDLFMELSARVDVDVADGTSVFLYGGPVGEPALGPSAFMHRGSAKYQPLSPITHHWFDSTHISYGVVTAGVAARTFQIEASAFRGREPDEHRWGIETPRLDSWSVRGSWTPTPHWALQVSHGRLKEPEELEPGRNEDRTTASVQYASGGLSTTFAFSSKNKQPGPALTAFLAEANWDISSHHSVFGRVENVANDELFPDPASPLHERKFRVTKSEVGYAYRLPLTGPLNLALGGTVGSYALPSALDAAYGKTPVSFTLFAKLSLGH